MAGCDNGIFSFLGGGGGGHEASASITRSNDTENYLPFWEGWFVEGDAEETAFVITAGSDDDASAKEYTIRILTQYCFQWFEYYLSYLLIVFPSPSL